MRAIRSEGEIMKKEEYLLDLNELELALGEEGYIETEHRKSGRSNTDNTLSNQAIIFPTFGSTRRKKPNPEEKESLKGKSLTHDADTESTHNREVNFEALPRSKTHNDLK